MEPTSKFVKAQGINHHYLDWGNPTAPPLLLLHAVGLCASTWNRAARSLSADFHVMCFDQRGHGDTEATDQNLTFHQAVEGPSYHRVEGRWIKCVSPICFDKLPFLTASFEHYR